MVQSTKFYTRAYYYAKELGQNHSRIVVVWSIYNRHQVTVCASRVPRVLVHNTHIVSAALLRNHSVVSTSYRLRNTSMVAPWAHLFGNAMSRRPNRDGPNLA